MDRYTVVFDLDNTIVDTDCALREALLRDYNIDIDQYYTHTGKWDVGYNEIGDYINISDPVIEIFSRPNFFRSLKLFPGVSEFLPKIVQLCQGYDFLPLIATAPPKDKEGYFFSIDQKYNWAIDNIPYFPIDNLVIVSNKESIIDTSIVTVEDDLITLKKAAVIRGNKHTPELVCFKRKWNSFDNMGDIKKSYGIKSVSSWSEIYQIIEDAIITNLNLKETKYGII